MSDCIFCKIISGEEKGWQVHRGRGVTAFLDAFPVTEGHVIVATDRHVRDVFDLKEEEFLEIMRVAREMGLRMKKKLGADFVNIIVAESIIKHAFVHVVPRYEHDLMGVVPDMDNKRALPKEEMDELRKKLGGGKGAGQKNRHRADKNRN